MNDGIPSSSRPAGADAGERPINVRGPQPATDDPWLVTMCKDIATCAEKYVDDIYIISGVTTVAEHTRLVTDVDPQEALFHRYQKLIELKIADFTELKEARPGIRLPRNPNTKDEDPRHLNDETICRLLGIYAAGGWTLHLMGTQKSSTLHVRFS